MDTQYKVQNDYRVRFAYRAISDFETSPAATSALTHRFDSFLLAARMHWRNALLPTGWAEQKLK